MHIASFFLAENCMSHSHNPVAIANDNPRKKHSEALSKL